MAKYLGRNDPCFCGSLRSYKRCCMEKDTATGIRRLGTTTEVRRSRTQTAIAAVTPSRVTIALMVIGLAGIAASAKLGMPFEPGRLAYDLGMVALGMAVFQLMLLPVLQALKSGKEKDAESLAKMYDEYLDYDRAKRETYTDRALDQVREALPAILAELRRLQARERDAAGGSNALDGENHARR